MKNIFSKFVHTKTRLMALLICMNAANISYSQTLQTPTATQNFWYRTTSSGTKPMQGFNAAMMAFGAGAPYSHLFVSAFFDGTSGELVVADDGSFGAPASYALSATPAGVPDVILTNWDGSSTCTNCTLVVDNNYFATVLYEDASNNVVMDIFAIYDDGSSTPSVALEQTYTVVLGTTGIVPHIVHIDALADYTISTGSGFPVCDEFALTYDDFQNGVSAPNVYLQWGSINNIVARLNNSLTVTLGSVGPINPGGQLGGGQMPDVCLIRNGNNNDHREAYITYVDETNTTLSLYDYDLNAASATGPTTLDAGTNNSNGIHRPRIDGIDNYLVNVNAGISIYKVVAEVDSTSGHKIIRSYDNTTLGTSPYYWPSSRSIDVTGAGGSYSFFPPSGHTYDHFAPVVATGGGIYDIGHFTNYNLGTTGDDVFFAERINSFNPYALALNKYYWVNGSSATNVDAASCSYASAVCNSTNSPALNKLFAWAFFNVSTSKYEVDYKFTSSVANPGFKEEQETAAALPWQVYPNPVTDELYVRGADKGTLRYRVTDMAGRELMRGAAASNGGIDVHGLAAGTYAISVQQGAQMTEKLFVKE